MLKSKRDLLNICAEARNQHKAADRSLHHRQFLRKQRRQFAKGYANLLNFLRISKDAMPDASLCWSDLGENMPQRQKSEELQHCDKPQCALALLRASHDQSVQERTGLGLLRAERSAALILIRQVLNILSVDVNEQKPIYLVCFVLIFSCFFNHLFHCV